MHDETANLANSAKLMITEADYFQDVGLHCQLAVEMVAEITNGLHRSDHLSPMDEFEKGRSFAKCTTLTNTAPKALK